MDSSTLFIKKAIFIIKYIVTNRYFQSSIAIIFTASIIGCKSVSKYTIDDKPSIKIDTNLFGIWKTIEDTDKADYIFVQNYYDVHYNAAYKDRRLDKWDLRYTEYNEKKDYYYYITRMDYHGTNPHYQQWSVFVSKVSNATFLNIPYRYTPVSDDGHFLNEPAIEGYFFVKFININNAYDTLTIATVADTTLKKLTSSKEVRKRIRQNANNPTFYSDTLHFYKVSGYHVSLSESVNIAN